MWPGTWPTLIELWDMKIRSDHDPGYPMPLTSINTTTSQKVLCFLSGPRTTHPLLLCHWIDFAKMLIVAVSLLLEPVEWFLFAPSITSKLWDKVHRVPCESLQLSFSLLLLFFHYITTMQLLPALQHAMLSHLQSWALIFPLLRALLSFPTTLPNPQHPCAPAASLPRNYLQQKEAMLPKVTSPSRGSSHTMNDKFIGPRLVPFSFFTNKLMEFWGHPNPASAPHRICWHLLATATQFIFSLCPVLIPSHTLMHGTCMQISWVQISLRSCGPGKPWLEY